MLQILKMAFLARILRYLFWLAVVSWSLAIMRRLVNQMGGGARTNNIDVPSDAVTQKLVRDPVCGMHIAEGLAVTLKQGNEILYFCSAECRDKYLNDTRKFAANA